MLYFTGLTKLQVVIRKMSQETGKVFHIRHATDKNMREILMEAKRKQWTNIIADLSSKQTALLLKMVKYLSLPNKWITLKLLLLCNSKDGIKILMFVDICYGLLKVLKNSN